MLVLVLRRLAWHARGGGGGGGGGGGSDGGQDPNDPADFATCETPALYKGDDHTGFLWDDFDATGTRSEKQFARVMCCVDTLRWPKMVELGDGLSWVKVPGDGAVSKSGACWPGKDGHGTANKVLEKCYNEADCRALCSYNKACLGFTYYAALGKLRCELHAATPSWTTPADSDTVCYAKVGPGAVFTAPPPTNPPRIATAATAAKVSSTRSTTLDATVKAITAGDDYVNNRPTLNSDEADIRSKDDSGKGSSTTSFTMIILGVVTVLFLGTAVCVVSAFRQRRTNRLGSSLKLLTAQDDSGESLVGKGSDYSPFTEQ